MHKFVMFCGLAGAGKDTLAKYVGEHLRGRFCIDGFAEPLRRTTRTVFGAFSLVDRGLKERRVDVWESGATEAVHRCLVELGATHDEVETGMGYWKEVAGEYLAKRGRLLISPREFMQKLGTEVGRRVREDIFLDSLVSRNKDSGIVLVTDCRFENELNLADVAYLIKSSHPLTPPVHVSELMAYNMLTLPHIAVSKATLDLRLADNTGSLVDLYTEAAKIAKYLEQTE